MVESSSLRQNQTISHPNSHSVKPQIFYRIQRNTHFSGQSEEEGFLVGASFIPVLPFLSDSDEHLEEMVKAAKDYGASFVFVGGLTLFGNGPSDCKVLYYKILGRHFPELLPRYKSLYRIFFAPSREYQRGLEERSERLCKRYGVKHGLM